MLRHGQNPRDRLASPTDYQLSFSGNQLGQLAETGTHLTDIELFHQRLTLCCNFSRCSTCGGAVTMQGHSCEGGSTPERFGLSGWRHQMWCAGGRGKSSVGLPSASSNRPGLPEDRCRASSSTVSRRITVVRAERIRSVTLMAERPRQLSPRQVPHPGFVRCGWC